MNRTPELQDSCPEITICSLANRGFKWANHFLIELENDFSGSYVIKKNKNKNFIFICIFNEII